MTYEEALNYFNMRINLGQCGKSTTQRKAFETAIEALEKQIPKKPVNIEDKMWGCPICSNHLLRKWREYPTELMPKSLGFPHCTSCGQAIDWRK